MTKNQITTEKTDVLEVSENTENMEPTEVIEETKSVSIAKPKKQLTEKQKEALQKGRLVRQEKLKIKRDEKLVEEERLQKFQVAEENKKVVVKKKQEKIIQKYLEPSPETETESDNEEIVIIKTAKKSKQKETKSISSPEQTLQPIEAPKRKFTALKNKNTKRLQHKDFAPTTSENDVNPFYFV